MALVKEGDFDSWLLFLLVHAYRFVHTSYIITNDVTFSVCFSVHKHQRIKHFSMDIAKQQESPARIIGGIWVELGGENK